MTEGKRQEVGPRRWSQLLLVVLGSAIVLWVLTSGELVTFNGTATVRLRITWTETVVQPKASPASQEGGQQQQQQPPREQQREQQQQQPEQLSTQGGGGSSTASTPAGPGAAGGAAAAAGQESPSTSSVRVHAAYDRFGQLTKSYYSLYNVRLTKNKIQFFAPPGFKQPTKQNWVDPLHNNGSNTPPTGLSLKMEGPSWWGQIAVDYAAQPAEAEKCRSWVDKPAYLLHVRHSSNIWHSLNDGLMGAFQTLREQGALPLAHIDAQGNVREVTEGMGKGCALVWDQSTNNITKPTSCLPKTGVVDRTHCALNSEQWCRPGVRSYLQENGPVIIRYHEGVIPPAWEPMYKAISSDIRALSQVEGLCFRHLIISKTTTLNFYQPFKYFTPSLEARSEAVGVFRAFMTTAQQELLQRQAALEPSLADFKGYADKVLERLHRGVGPEDVELLDTLLPPLAPKGVSVGAEELHRLWKKKYDKSKLPKPYHLDYKARQARQLDRQQALTGMLGMLPNDPPRESPRPVVTFMARHYYRRAVLNKHEVLKYILSRYNVTVRITTFEEPLLEAIGVMQHTDVLIGMHGAGWVNALFLKQGAVAIQLFPYGFSVDQYTTIRGSYYRSIVRGSKCKYLSWTNPHPHYAFFRYKDLKKSGADLKNHTHPTSQDRLPKDPEASGGTHWLYQNTYVDLDSFGPVIDTAMKRARIKPMKQAVAAQ